jgi:hypothetical protein
MREALHSGAFAAIQAFALLGLMASSRTGFTLMTGACHSGARGSLLIQVDESPDGYHCRLSGASLSLESVTPRMR